MLEELPFQYGIDLHGMQVQLDSKLTFGRCGDSLWLPQCSLLICDQNVPFFFFWKGLIINLGLTQHEWWMGFCELTGAEIWHGGKREELISNVADHYTYHACVMTVITPQSLAPAPHPQTSDKHSTQWQNWRTQGSLCQNILHCKTIPLPALSFHSHFLFLPLLIPLQTNASTRMILDNNPPPSFSPIWLLKPNLPSPLSPGWHREAFVDLSSNHIPQWVCAVGSQTPPNLRLPAWITDINKAELSSSSASLNLSMFFHGEPSGKVLVFWFTEFLLSYFWYQFKSSIWCPLVLLKRSNMPLQKKSLCLNLTLKFQFEIKGLNIWIHSQQQCSEGSLSSWTFLLSVQITWNKCIRQTLCLSDK